MFKTNPKPVETEPAAIDATSTSSPSRLARFLKEPLLHFLLAGANIYLLYALYGKQDAADAIAEQNTIVVSQGEIDWLTESWQKRWNRLPTEAELQGLIRDHVKETILYREAMAMGLDKDDVIIRRRLKQKLEFLAQDLIQPEPATDEELQAYFEKHKDRYQPPELITFTHVFFDPDRRAEKTLDDAKQLKAELSAKSQPPSKGSQLGDPFMLQRYYPERSEADVSKLFGREFASSIMDLESEQWHGPVLSGYGTHLVFVHGRREFPPPAFENVADQVREDLENEERQQLNDEYFSGLLSRYQVVVEGDDDFTLTEAGP